MDEHEDAMIASIADALRPLPDVDGAAKARLLVAVAAERERDREAARRRATIRKRSAWVLSVAAAALFVVMVLPARRTTPAVATIPASSPSVLPGAAPAPAQLATHDANDAEALQPVQLVFRAPTAASVRVVGDFNAWDKERAPMTRDAETGLWSVTLSLRPGRHVYAFVVDDSVWMRDPRAVAAPDADFGRPGSVLLVSRP